MSIPPRRDLDLIVRLLSIAAALVAQFAFVALIALVVFEPRAFAQDRPTLSGSWSASAMTERWNIGDWGDACGPKPSPHGAGGGGVTVTESGGELAFSGGGYARTNMCFEQGFGVTSHSASPRFWRTRCGTGPSDPRKATIVTTVSATDTTISFDETGEYQFILKDQNCTASVRRNRTYSLQHRLGDDAPPAASTAPPVPSAAAIPTPAPTPTPAPPPAPTPTGACTDPGDVSRIEVRPSSRLMKPGETFQLKSVLLDDAGCRVPQMPAWSVPPDSKLTVSSTGLVTVAQDAPEGETQVSAAVNGRSVKVTIEVVSPDRYAALLAGGQAAENDEAAVAIVTSGGLGSKSATAQDSSKKRKTIFLGIVSGAVLALGIAGIVLYRRQKPETEEVEEIIPAETKMVVVRKKRLVQKKADFFDTATPATLPSAEGQPPKNNCPTCGKAYPDTVTFCPNDGTKLGGAPPPGQGVIAQAAGPSKICPVCGLRYPLQATFCGKEGATLVLVN